MNFGSFYYFPGSLIVLSDILGFPLDLMAVLCGLKFKAHLPDFVTGF